MSLMSPADLRAYHEDTRPPTAKNVDYWGRLHMANCLSRRHSLITQEVKEFISLESRASLAPPDEVNDKDVSLVVFSDSSALLYEAGGRPTTLDGLLQVSGTWKDFYVLASVGATFLQFEEWTRAVVYARGGGPYHWQQNARRMEYLRTAHRQTESPGGESYAIDDRWLLGSIVPGREPPGGNAYANPDTWKGRKDAVALLHPNNHLIVVWSGQDFADSSCRDGFDLSEARLAEVAKNLLLFAGSAQLFQKSVVLYCGNPKVWGAPDGLGRVICESMRFLARHGDTMHRHFSPLRGVSVPRVDPEALDGQAHKCS